MPTFNNRHFVIANKPTPLHISFLCCMKSLLLPTFLFLLHALNMSGQASETGLATMHVNAIQGKISAFGEPYDTSDFAAASATFGHNDLVRVTRIDDERSVVVRINDRLVTRMGRVIDFTPVAARKIGIGPGEFVNVRVTLIEAGVGQLVKDRLRDFSRGDSHPPVPMHMDGQKMLVEALPLEHTQPPSREKPTGTRIAPSSIEGSDFSNGGQGAGDSVSQQENEFSYGAQLGAFSKAENAKAFAEKLKKSHQIGHLRIVEKSNMDGQQLYAVISGLFETREEAEQEVLRLSELGISSLPVNTPQR